MVRAMTASGQPHKPQGSKIARASAARLAAAQAVYQIMTNDQDAETVINEYRLYRLGKPVDDIEMVTPDGVLFQTIVAGVYGRMNLLMEMIADATRKGGKTTPAEPLLLAIMLCGAWELLDNPEIDAPVILSDYLNVTHAFYEQGEAKFINGVLDAIRQTTRPAP